jgi:uncharacterized surface protein with fasciclin (FAS1) repeats
MRYLTVLVLFFAAACAGSTGSADHADTGIPKVLAEQDRFSTLVELMRASGVDLELAAGGPYTLFAPTNAAFEGLDEGRLREGLEPKNRDRLRAVLRYHVVPGRLTRSELQAAGTIETLEGHGLSVENASGRVLVGEALVSDANIVADNGVIHAVDSIIEPPAEYLEDLGRSETTGMKGGPDAWWW